MERRTGGRTPRDGAAVPELAGATACDGRYALRELLHGAPEQGVWVGVEVAGGRPVLITLGPPVPATAREELALDVPGVTALLALGDGPGGLAAAVEERPPGAPAAPAAEQAAALGAAVADLGAFAHHMGLALAGLRPEAVWSDGDEVVLAPRPTRLWELAGADPDGPAVFRSRERLRGGGASPADDIFALGATVALWATGEHPFEGDTAAQQAHAILDRRRRLWRGDPRLEPVVAAALGPRELRPPMDALEAALRELA
jgi:eukaryotic-like serine/threonine-protein kinase